MKKRFSFLLIAYFMSGLVVSQELVYNGSFEEHVCLPEHISEILCCIGWSEFNWQPSGSPPYSTPDYYIDSAPYNLASIAALDCEIETHHGAATMRIGAYRKSLKNYREYLATRLLASLEPGATYRISLWVNNGSSFPDNSNLGYGCTGLGINFSTQRLTAIPHEVIDIKPQIEVREEIWVNEWTEYRFDFRADSTYRYMSIGFFQNDSIMTYVDHLAHQSNIPKDRTAYYFLDDISLTRKEGVFGDELICKGDSTELRAFFRNGQYAWIEASRPDSVLSNADRIVVRPAETTTYVVYSGVSTSSFTVRVVPDKVNILDQDTAICDGNAVEVSLPGNVHNFEWQDGSTENPRFLTKAGQYEVHVFDHHCVSSDTMDVRVFFCGCDPFIPNTFTPNDDRLNDIFLPLFDCPISDYHFSVFNRWGEMLFETSSVETGWNGWSAGKSAPVGAYVYLLKYELYDGLEHEKRGIVNLLR